MRPALIHALQSHRKGFDNQGGSKPYAYIFFNCAGRSVNV